MSSPADRLIYMANQIGTFFRSQGHDKAVPGIADHIKKFWDPRMKRAIFAHLDAGGRGPRAERARSPDLAQADDVPSGSALNTRRSSRCASFSRLNAPSFWDPPRGWIFMTRNIRLRPIAMRLTAATWLALGLSWTAGKALADDRPWLDRTALRPWPRSCSATSIRAAGCQSPVQPKTRTWTRRWIAAARRCNASAYEAPPSTISRNTLLTSACVSRTRASSEEKSGASPARAITR
ncbi:hypothetical protein ACVI1I_000338 [Bradyrhizobium sp. USDA 4459]